MEVVKSFLKKIPLWHILVWVIYLLIELYLFDSGFGGSIFKLISRFSLLLILTYVNIFYLFPKYYQGINTVSYIKYCCLTVFLFAIVYSFLLFIFDASSCNNSNCSGHSYSFANLLYSFISFLIFTLAFAMSHYVSSQKKQIFELEMNKKNIEMELLQSQMDPHTLLNNMNTLYWKAMESDQDELSEMIADVSDMLRYTIYETKRNYIDIDKEIVFLEKLISFQSQRGKDHFTINFTNQLSNQKILIPPLIFAPLVENCFKHSASNSKNVIIDLSIWDDAQFIYFESVNNFNKDIYKNINKNKGVGLDNLKKRLQLLYPEKQYLNVTVKKDLFKVEIKVPKHYE